jgi:hypothetical protein
MTDEQVGDRTAGTRTRLAPPIGHLRELKSTHGFARILANFVSGAENSEDQKTTLLDTPTARPYTDACTFGQQVGAIHADRANPTAFRPRPTGSPWVIGRSPPILTGSAIAASLGMTTSDKPEHQRWTRDGQTGG